MCSSRIRVAIASAPQRVRLSSGVIITAILPFPTTTTRTTTWWIKQYKVRPNRTARSWNEQTATGRTSWNHTTGVRFEQASHDKSREDSVKRRDSTERFCCVQKQYTYIYIYIYMYVCTYVCMYILYVCKYMYSTRGLSISGWLGAVAKLPAN